MPPRLATLAAASMLVALTTACSHAGPRSDDELASSPPRPSSPPATPAPSQSATPPDMPAGDAVIGTVVRFSSEQAVVDVTIDRDSPAVRDFLSMLPLTLTFEDFGGREKIAYLPRELDHAGTPGSDPEDGDLIYYSPWGNLGFYYDAAGIGHSDDVLHLGAYDAGLDQLGRLEGVVVVESVG